MLTRLLVSACDWARGRAPAFVAVLLDLASGRAGAQLAWTFDGCAGPHGGSIVVTTCGDCGSYVSTATVVPAVQGTLTMRLDYELGSPATYEQLRLSTPTEGLYALPWSEPWC